MPRADDYRLAANRFRALRDHFETQSHTLRNAELAGAEGPVAHRVEAAYRRLASAAADAGTGFAQLADECVERAGVCEAYATAVHVWQQIPPTARLFVRPPRRPAPWAEL